MMKNTLLSILILLTIQIVACSPTSETKEPKVTSDFLYGAWTDSLKSKSRLNGIVFASQNNFYFITNGDVRGGDSYGNNLMLTYNYRLDQYPIEVEVISKYIDTGQIKTRGLWTIEVVDDRHIIWKALDDNRKTIESTILTKLPNQFR